MPIGRLLSIVLLLPSLVIAQTAQRDVWEPFKFFVGSWEGTGKGQPGVSKTLREYRFVLNGKFLYIQNSNWRSRGRTSRYTPRIAIRARNSFRTWRW